MVAAMGRGGGKTPERVVKKINELAAEIGQNATARAIGLPLRSVQKYMIGIAEPSQATLEKIACYFWVSVAWLRGGAVGPVERLLEGLKIKGVDPATFNKKIADEMEKEGDHWRGLVTGHVNSDWAEMMGYFFGINEYWITTGRHPTLLNDGGIVGTLAIRPKVQDPNLDKIDAKLVEWHEGDNPDLADYIAFCMRENPELRKRVEKLLIDEEPPVSRNN